jgi:hypothetical protein
LFGDGEIWGGTEDSVYQFSIQPRIQKCSSIKVLIEDVSPTGESFELSALTFEVGLKQGMNKLVGKKRT